MPRNVIKFSLFALVAASALIVTPSAEAQCTGANHVTWPAVNPVWDFCWVRPSATMQPDGEGIRITDVFYKGVKIFKDGGIPVLNVKYNPGGCGGGSLCFRDWFDQERAFACAPSPSAGYCTGTTTAVSTVCNHPGTDSGTFSGVAVVDKGTSLKMTSQTQAGWYRYIATWEFFPDGSIRPGMDITAVNNSCVAFTHRHHAYWRLDFDLDAQTANFADVVTDQASTRVTNEAMYVDQANSRSQWRLGRNGSATRVHVVRNQNDGFANGDTFGVGDGWILSYKNTELHDNSSGCEINLPFVNAENTNNTDIVMWVHSMVDHVGEVGGVSHECFMFGPWIKVRLRPTPADWNGNGMSDIKVYNGAGAWHSYALSGTAAPDVFTGAGGTCIPSAADYDGDGTTDYSLYCQGAYHFFNKNGSYLKGIWTGLANAKPVPADYNGDGKDEVALFDNGAWFFYDFDTGAQTSSVWTGPGAGSIGMPMDYDGDGKAELTAYMGGAWHFFNDDGSYNKGIWTGGRPNDVPVPGDYDGDGTEDVMIFADFGAWLKFDFATGNNVSGVWTGPGSPAGKPTPLDSDGDGSVDFAVYDGGPWHFYTDSGSYLGGVFTAGGANGIPISRRHIR